jgi:hypothetical protein
LKNLINRALYQFGVGIFAGAAVAQADPTGVLLFFVGFAIGLWVFLQ